MNEPGLLLADEPTGNLDRTTGQGVLDVLCALARERGMTMVVVTHDPATAARADRSVRLVDGLVASEAAALGAGG
jgi:predicted ABC-type transport system involved in lysophospholipase L1 biosynthesis ATPase subunit